MIRFALAESVTEPVIVTGTFGFIVPARVVVPLRALTHRCSGELYAAELFLAKSEFAKVYHDSQGVYRWITIHPHGDEEEGVPVKIRESKTEPGTYHVVAGAGGRLNYLRLTNVKSVEEYKRQSAEKVKAKREAAKQEGERRQEELAGMSDEEREARRAQEKATGAKKQELQQEIRLKQQEYIAKIAAEAGWADEDWKFEPVAEKLRAAGTSEKRIEQLERAHHKRVVSRAREVERQTRRQLLLDHEARLQAGLGQLPLIASEAETLALTDLDPDRIERGLGYRRDISKSSDREITAQLAEEDIERLREQVDAAQDAYNPNQPATVGTVRALQAQLHTAELVRRASTEEPQALEARDKELAQTVAAVEQDRLKDRPELLALRGVLRSKDRTPTREEEARLADLEGQDDQFRRRIEKLSDERDDIAIMLGSREQLVGGEKKELSGKRQQEREEEIRAEKGQQGVEAYRNAREMLARGLAEYRAEIQSYKSAGILKKPDLPGAAVQDPQAAVNILKAGKALTQLEARGKKAMEGEEADEIAKLWGGGMFIETRDAEINEDLHKAAVNHIAEMHTRSFLHELETTEKDPSLLDLAETEKREALHRYVSAGTYNALNNASLVITRQALLSREVADVLGTAGAAQVLARAVRKSRSPEDVRAIAEGLGDWHLQNHIEASEEAVRTAQSLYDQAHEIELGAAANPADLAVQQELNARRREALTQAREILGRTLGELESVAALSVALKEKPRDQLQVSLGPIGSESAIRQARAIGLARADYDIDTDGVNRFLTVHESGLDKLAQPVDQEELRTTERVLAIKAGQEDEEGWIPPGLESYPATAFDPKPNGEPASFGYHLQEQRPPSSWGTAGTGIEQDVRHYIGAAMADGMDPNDLLPELMTAISQAPGGEQQKGLDTINQIMPLTIPALNEKGKPIYKTDANGEAVRDEAGNPIQDTKNVKADYYEPVLTQIAEDYVQRYQGIKGQPQLTAFHSQGLKLDSPEDRQKAATAMHLAIAEDPRAVVAFKDPGDLSSQDQAALRHYFNTKVAKVDLKTGLNVKGMKDRIVALGPEPDKYTGAVQSGLFGGGGEREISPKWSEWNDRRNAITSEAQDGSTNWAEYTQMHHGTVDAYAALQDALKSDFIGRFQQRYGKLTGETLRLGKRAIRNSERHLAFVDPAKREEQLSKERRLQDELRRRIQGKYAAGSVKDRMDRVLQRDEIERQNNASLFGAGAGKAPAKAFEAEPGTRLALGMRAENQIKSLMQNVGANFTAHTDQPIKLFPNFSMSGSYVNQQRAVKSFLAAKRMGAFLSTGAGKTPIAIGAFTAAMADPKSGVKRGIFVVPSQVQGQFHGEFARFAKPGALKWSADPGAGPGQRLAAYRDQDTNAVVMTHQGFRDDMLRNVSEHWGTDREAASKRFMGLTRRERAKVLKATWDKQGIDFQASFLDEGHVTLDRQGKPDSLLSAMMTAVSDNTPYYMAMTADPAKNDISEIRSQLDKLYPDGRYGDEADWNRRYGLNTTASREALRRQVQGRFFTSTIRPPIQARKTEDRFDLHPEQTKEYEHITDLADRARLDRSKGKINVDAMRELSPGSFEGKPEKEHEAIARRLTENVGIIRDAALNRAVNLAPAESNAKIQAILKRLKDHPVKDKPVVIFAHNLEAVHHIEDALKKAGQRVATLTGEHSSEEKDKRRRMFQPEKGTEPQADILVLSDAGATGLNLQRGQTLIQFDTPMTAMVAEQRKGRINRLGQTQDVDLVDLTTNSDFEERARKRLTMKYDLRQIFADPGESLDDTGLAAYIARARKEASQVQDSQQMRLAA
jgi:hypothetical protein